MGVLNAKRKNILIVEEIQQHSLCSWTSIIQVKTTTHALLSLSCQMMVKNSNTGDEDEISYPTTLNPRGLYIAPTSL